MPMAPEFAQMLLAVPEYERSGRVFRLPGLGGGPPSPDWVSRIVTKIGKVANVRVSDKAGQVKYASAHDFRRSFGARWSTRVMPAVLQELMRHESIETTMRCYVGRNAQRTADVVWSAFEALNVSLNADRENPQAPVAQSDRAADF